MGVGVGVGVHGSDRSPEYPMSVSVVHHVQLETLSHTHSIIPNLNFGLVPVDYESGYLLSTTKRQD